MIVKKEKRKKNPKKRVTRLAGEKSFPQVPGRSVNDFHRAAEEERWTYLRSAAESRFLDICAGEK